ncbi:MAG: ABC transporter substrate-binding protein [Thermomicrobiales bacterium]
MRDERIARLIDEARSLHYSRRTAIKRAVALGLSVPAVTAALDATVGAAPAPGPRFAKAPNQNQGTRLTILASNYFVPDAQTFFDQQLDAWGAENNVEVSADYVNWPDLQPKIGAAVNSKAGPDIIEMYDPWPYLYYQNMVDLHDLATRVGEASGGYFDWVTNTASVDGQWYGVPIGTPTSTFTYRMSYFNEVGATEFPRTWEELFQVGKRLKEMGKPIGQALGHSLGDPGSHCYPYMWAYGAMEVAEDGSTVAFNKPEFVEGMTLFIQGWKDAYDETGLSWDDSVNNSAFLSDQLSATLNGSSIYLAALGPEAEGGKPEIAEDINHADYPEGPAGRYNLLGSRCYSIMSYSENVEGARAFLEWWSAPEQFQGWLEANKGYFIPPTPRYVELPVYTEDPKLAPYANVVTYARNKGYAGPANQKAAEVFSRYVVIDTFATAVQDGEAEGAIEEGARLLERIYGG